MMRPPPTSPAPARTLLVSRSPRMQRDRGRRGVIGVPPTLITPVHAEIHRREAPNGVTRVEDDVTRLPDLRRAERAARMASPPIRAGARE